MRSKNKTKKLLTYLWIIFILVSFSYSLVKIGQTDFRSGEQWENYYSIFASDGSQVESLLNDNNVIDYISLNNSIIRYNDISAMEEVALKEIDTRFNSLDPRFDPYMKKISGLFTAHSENIDYEIIYVEKNALSIYKLFWIMFRHFQGKSLQWFIGGFDGISLVSPGILFFFYWTISLFFMANKRKGFIGRLNWFPFVFFGGYPACALAITCSNFIDRKKYSVYVPVIISLFLIYVYFVKDFTIYSIISLVIALLSNFVILSSQKRIQIKEKNIYYTNTLANKWRIPRFRLGRSDHELFSPVKIMHRVKRKVKTYVVEPVPGTHKNVLLIIAVLFLSIIPLFLFLAKTQEPMILPLWEEQGKLEWSLKNTEFLDISEREDESSIFSPADYISHVAFQDSFLYGSEWEYPNRDKPVLYPHFVEERNQISKSYEILVDYSEKWFESKISMLNNDNPAKLLFSTETPGFVIKKSNHYNNQSFILLKFSFSMLLLLLLIFSYGNKYKNISFKVKKKLLRRNEQVA